MGVKLLSSGGGSVTLNAPNTASDRVIEVPDIASGKLAVADTSGNFDTNYTWQGNAVAVAYGGTGGTTQATARQGIGALGQGKQVLGCWTAAAITPRITNGCSGAIPQESTTYKVMLKACGFNATTTQYGQFSFKAPAGLSEGTFTAKFVWKEAASATAHGCVWGIQMLALSDGETIDTDFGTAVTVTDTGSSGTILHTAETGAITPSNTWAAGDEIIVQVYRDAANGSDTLDVDAQLIEVVIYATYAADVEP